jgi:hypothetical protein
VSSERRRNAIALGIAAAVVIVLAVLAIRPAVVLPVTNDVVANSLKSVTDALKADCRDAQGEFRCTVKIGSDSGGSRTRTMRVHVDWDGCWRAVEEEPPHQPTRADGCLHAWNY